MSATRFLVDRDAREVHFYSDALAAANPTFEEVWADNPQEALTKQASVGTGSGGSSGGALTDAELRATAVDVNVTGGSISIGATVTADAGVNLNTSLLALEGGGNLALIKTKTDNLDALLSSRLKPADTLTGVTTVGAVTVITNPLPAGANLLGKTGIDQTTPGTTNKVYISNDGSVTLLAGAAAIGKLAVNDGVDIGDVTINNGAAAAAVNIQDGGNSITIDGSLTNLAQFNGQAIVLGSGVRTAGTLRVTVATDDSVPVTNANLDVALSTRLKPGDVVGVTNASLDTLATAVKLEDAASASADAGVVMLASRHDLPDTDTSLDGDYSAVKTDAKGRVWVNSDVIAALLAQQIQLLATVIGELRMVNTNLARGLNIPDENEAMRADPSFVTLPPMIN